MTRGDCTFAVRCYQGTITANKTAVIVIVYIVVLVEYTTTGISQGCSNLKSQVAIWKVAREEGGGGIKGICKFNQINGLNLNGSKLWNSPVAHNCIIVQ